MMRLVLLALVAMVLQSNALATPVAAATGKVVSTRVFPKVPTTLRVYSPAGAPFVISGYRGLLPTITLKRVGYYRFAVHAAGNGFFISSQKDGALKSAAWVDNNGSSLGSVYIKVKSSSPDVLYYRSKENPTKFGRILIVPPLNAANHAGLTEESASSGTSEEVLMWGGIIGGALLLFVLAGCACHYSQGSKQAGVSRHQYGINNQYDVQAHTRSYQSDYNF